MAKVSDACPVCKEARLDVNVVAGAALAQPGASMAPLVGPVSCLNMCHTGPEWREHQVEVEAVRARVERAT